MAGYDRKVRGPPVVVHLVHVAVANAAIENLDLDVARSRVASLDRHRSEGCLGCAGAIGRSLLGHGPTKTRGPVSLLCSLGVQTRCAGRPPPSGETAQSRPLVVHTSTRLPSGSESVHQEGAYLSVTRWPPAAIAAATRASPCSGGTHTSMCISGSGASNFWNQIGVPRLCGSTTSSGLSARSWYPRTARQNGFTLGMSCASTVSWTVLTTDGSAGRLSLRATAEICRANSTSRSVIPM